MIQSFRGLLRGPGSIHMGGVQEFLTTNFTVEPLKLDTLKLGYLINQVTLFCSNGIEGYFTPEIIRTPL